MRLFALCARFVADSGAYDANGGSQMAVAWALGSTAMRTDPRPRGVDLEGIQTMNAEDMTERARKLIEQDQVQLLTDYEVHPDAWKGDPDRCDAVAALADAILEPAAAELARLRAALAEGRELGHVEAILSALEAQEQAEEAHDARVKAEAERDAARAKALEDAAKRNELTVRSIKEALDLRDWDAARVIAMKGPAAIRAMIQTSS